MHGQVLLAVEMSFMPYGWTVMLSASASNLMDSSPLSLMTTTIIILWYVYFIVLTSFSIVS